MIFDLLNIEEIARSRLHSEGMEKVFTTYVVVTHHTPPADLSKRRVSLVPRRVHLGTRERHA